MKEEDFELLSAKVSGSLEDVADLKAHVKVLTERLKMQAIEIEALKKANGNSGSSVSLETTDDLKRFRKELDEIRTALLPGLPLKMNAN